MCALRAIKLPLQKAKFLEEKNGTLWSWGSNINGKLGIDFIITRIKSPIQVGNESNWHYINTSIFFQIFFSEKLDLDILPG